MKYVTIALFVFLALVSSVRAQAISQGMTLPSNSVAVTDNALSVLSNPAWLGARSGAEALLLFPYTDSTTSEDMGLLVKLGSLGFAGEFVHNDLEFYNHYTLGQGFALGSGFYAGISHSWWRVVDWQGSWNLGLGYRPLPYLSAGTAAFDLNQPNRDGVDVNPSYSLALALRPLGDRWTLSGDLLLTKDGLHDYGEELDPHVRLEALPLDGIRLLADYYTDSKFFGIGISLALDNLAAGNFQLMDEDGKGRNGVGYLHLTSSRQANLLSPKSHQIVEITLGGKIYESKPSFLFFEPEGKTLHQLRQEIMRYAEDPRVDGLLITFENPEWGLAQVQQIRRALEEFKATGKMLIAYSESYSQKDYYLATVCDEIYLLPIGTVDLKGLAAVMGYWKGTLDKLGIGVQVARVRDYKTAANTFIYEDTPAAEAEMMNWLLDDIYDQICTTIGDDRGWTIEEVNERIDGGPYNCARALDAGIVDSLAYYDSITEGLEDDDYALVSEQSYWRFPQYKEEWPDVRIPKVAVIYAEGAIISGESGSGLFGNQFMGSETIAKAIRTAREDKSIDAIILRVDSPGGSAIASDVIYRQVRRTVTDKKQRKPIIVSMGNVAGSGGYYIACGADTIIAEEGTITGSIGVLGGKFNLAGLHDKIYYNTHTFKRGEHSDAFSTSRPFTDEEMEMLQTTVEQFYQDFISRVAESRGLTEEEVDRVGEGRVWMGRQAVENKLVDLIGGMDVAFAVTRSSLGVSAGSALNLEFYPKPRGFFAAAAQEVLHINNRPVPKALAEAIEPLSLIAEFYDGEPLMLMPYRIEIK